MVLVLSRKEVVELIDMPELIETVERALVDLSRGEAINPNRLRIFIPEKQAMMACMPAYLGSAGMIGAKIVNSSDKPVPPGERRHLSSVLALGDTEGNYLAVMGGTLLTPLRSAAASAVAIRQLARADASVMAIIGCGVQGRAELAGAACVRKLTEIVVYDLDEGVAQRFQRDLGERLGLAIRVARTAEEAASAADIIVLATTSETPVLADRAIPAGAHINAVGAHTPRTRELESDTVARARLFVESRQSMRAEAGDVLIPLEEGRIQESHILGEIGEVVGGAVQGRIDAGDITVFKSTGLAIEDVSAAKLVYERAVARGIGTNIDI